MLKNLKGINSGQIGSCVAIYESEYWEVLLHVTVRTGARGREPLFLLFLGLVHRFIIKSAVVYLLALIIWGQIGGRLRRIFFFYHPCAYKFGLST